MAMRDQVQRADQCGEQPMGLNKFCPPTMVERLEADEKRLIARLAEVRTALAIIRENPLFVKLLEAIEGCR